MALSALSLATFFACGAPSESDPATDPGEGDGLSTVDEGTAGSALPCAAPLPWRVVRVDSEFELGRDDADDALRRAIAEWEQATGRTLFTLDTTQGSEIRLVYDERQATGRERSRLVGEMREIEEGLDLRRSRLASRTEMGNNLFRDHAAIVADLQSRVSAHNDLVREWNERGGAPPDVQRRLRAEGQSLDLENQQLQVRGQELQEMRRQIDEERARFEEDVAEYNRLAGEIDTRLPPSRIEAGVYREAIRVVNGRAASASREIRVFRFNDRDDLVRVIAHELGHSLGLGHVDAPNALMSVEYGPGTGQPQPRRALIRQVDVDALVALCPGLFGR
jgi:hypothetical protein